jgi:hypothetical protein
MLAHLSLLKQIVLAMSRGNFVSALNRAALSLAAVPHGFPLDQDKNPESVLAPPFLTIPGRI